jgi:hypothetical protein
MTQQKDLKRRIRERMEKTGESYTTARAHVLAERAPTTVVPPAVSPLAQVLAAPPGSPIAVVEPIDVTEEAAALGMKCKVLVNDGIDAPRALGKLLAVLAGTDDADLIPFRLVALGGVRPRPARWSNAEMRTFVARARAGIAGIGPNGWLLAYVSDGIIVLAMVSVWRDGTPTIFLRRADAAAVDEVALAAIRLR